MEVAEIPKIAAAPLAAAPAPSLAGGSALFATADRYLETRI
jgi:hypothetical protein